MSANPYREPGYFPVKGDRVVCADGFRGKVNGPCEHSPGYFWVEGIFGIYMLGYPASEMRLLQRASSWWRFGV